MSTQTSRKQAYDWLCEYNQTEALRRHATQVEAVMRYFARQAQADEDEWGVVGLLHDLDYEMYPQEHCVKTKEILIEKGADPIMIRAIISHGWDRCCQEEPRSQLEKTLFAIDELTGLVWAAAIMRPSKSTQDMKVKSALKKFKDKSFAAKVDREIIKQGAAMLAVELNELIEGVIMGLREWEKTSRD